MSSVRTSEPASGFSYAMAAKGRSSAKVSGSATPSSNTAEDAEGHAIDGAHLAKVEAQNGGDTSSVTSANNNDDSASTPNPASSESTWDTKSQNSDRVNKAADSPEPKADAADAAEAAEDAPKQQKPKLQDAPPPAVNIWQQRAHAFSQVKTSVAPTKQDKKPEAKKNGDSRKSATAGPRNRDQRQPADATRSRAHAPAPPPTGNDFAWPTVDTAREEEKKKAQVQEDKAEKPQKDAGDAPASKAGKTEWVNLPYVPTAVFETALPPRSGARSGRGGGRGGSHASGRAALQNGQGQATTEKSQSRPSEPAQEQAATANAAADRQSMPPPPKPVKADETRDAVQTNGVAAENGVASTMPNRHSSTRRNKSPRKVEGSGRRPSAASAVADGINGTQTDSAKVPNKERTFENPPPFREGKGGKRGRGGHRGGANGHFTAQPYTNGFSSDFSTAPFPQRGGHFSQQGRNGFRGGMRSQSIPFDYSRGQYSGYPIMPPQGYMPDYYAGYAPAASTYQPALDQAYLVPMISQQIEYYFSIENLIKDMFFRKHMDSQGFVFLSLVADFNRLKALTTDYDLLKYVCMNSPNIEIRVGQDGKDRLRKVGDWERWVLPVGERDPTAQNEGPAALERPSIPQLEMAAPFYPAGVEQFPDHTGLEEFRGRQTKSPHRENGMSPLGNLFVPAEDMGGEADNFPNTQIDNLTVVVRKHEVSQRRPPYHTTGSRTYSDGSIDSKNICEEVQKTKNEETQVQTNGEQKTNGDAAAAVESPAVTLFWVKDQNQPVETLPADTTHEMYSHLRNKALSQREVAATGTCPYDMDVLYQFWSHFLIRNFNSSMYAEFRHLAFADASQRHNTTGMANLVKYYSEALSSQIPIREGVGRHFLELVKSENAGSERIAFSQLQASWKDGSFNLKNRKRFNDMLDQDLKAELEA